MGANSSTLEGLNGDLHHDDQIIESRSLLQKGNKMLARSIEPLRGYLFIDCTPRLHVGLFMLNPCRGKERQPPSPSSSPFHQATKPLRHKDTKTLRHKGTNCFDVWSYLFVLFERFCATRGRPRQHLKSTMCSQTKMPLCYL